MCVPVRRALIVEANGELFRFYYDRDRSDQLHIVARHGARPEDTIATFFRGVTIWNDRSMRYETLTETHCLYWTRHAHDRSVIIVSCFELGDN